MATPRIKIGLSAPSVVPRDTFFNVIIHATNIGSGDVQAGLVDVPLNFDNSRFGSISELGGFGSWFVAGFPRRSSFPSLFTDSTAVWTAVSLPPMSEEILIVPGDTLILGGFVIKALKNGRGNISINPVNAIQVPVLQHSVQDPAAFNEVSRLPGNTEDWSLSVRVANKV